MNHDSPILGQPTLADIPGSSSDIQISTQYPTDRNRVVKWSIFYTEKDIDSHPNILFLFGDNEQAKYRMDSSNPGGGGQALATRPTTAGKLPYDRLPRDGGIHGNVIGITTTFEEYIPKINEYKSLIDKEFKPLETWVKNGGFVVVPCNRSQNPNLGTGIAKLETKILGGIEYIRLKVEKLIQSGQQIPTQPMKSLDTLKEELHKSLLEDRKEFHSVGGLKRYLVANQAVVLSELQHKRARDNSESKDLNTVDSKRSKQDELRIKRDFEGKLKVSEAKRQKTSDEYPALGLKSTLHGDVYQLKLLMLYLKRGLDQGYSFRLATEMDLAEKFDDLVFAYDNESKDGIIYSLLQAKHKQDESKKITLSDLLTEKDDAFSLQKYFISYRKIKQNLQLVGTTNKIRDVIICTNINLDASLRDHFEEVEEEDNILDTKYINRESKRLKFKKCNFSIKDRLVRIFKEKSDLHRLAKKVAEHVFNTDGKDTNNTLKLTDKLFKKYHGALAEEVIDVETKSKKFKIYFIDCGPNLSAPAKQFRELLLEASKLSESNFKKELKAKSLNVSSKFGRVFKLETNPNITDKFTAKFVERMLKFSNKQIKIERRTKLFKNNIDKLAGHVLIIKDSKIQFRSGFLDNDILPKNLKKFKEKLRIELYNKQVNLNELSQYHCFINDFLTCTEEEYEKYEHDKSYFKHTLPSDKICIEEINEFLDKLVLAVNQPDEVTLGQIIETDMSEDKDINLIDSELIASYFLKFMLNWMKEKRGRFLTCEEGKAFFKEARKKIYTLMMIGPTLEYHAKIDGYGINFSEELTELQQFLSSREKQILNMISSCSIVCSIKVFQTLKTMPDYQKDDSHIFIRLSSLLLILDRVIKAFSSDTGKGLLVVECDTEDQDTQHLCQKLSGVIRFQKQKKILFITEKGSIFATQFKNHNHVYEEKEDFKNNFIDLTPDSQEILLKEKTITFQGRKVNLGTVIDDKLNDLINARVLSKLIRNENIVVGRELLGLEEVKYYYINRVFTRQINITDEIESEGSKFTFIYNTQETVSEIQQDKDVVLISNKDSDFRVLCNKYKENNIHWLKKENNELIWQETRGFLLNLLEYIDTNTHKEYDKISKITDVPDKLTIISAEPGMGKSTVLTKLLQDTIPSLWIVRINLNDHTEKLNSANFIHQNEAIDFLLNLIKFETPFENELFKKAINCNDKVALVFDGFDEISPDYKEEVVKLLKILKNTNVYKIWITTRPHLRSELEKELNVLSYNLKPISWSSQKVILKGIWIKVFGLVLDKESRLDLYAEKLLDLFLKSILYKETEFTGVPLHTKLLAEAFENDVKEFYNSQQNQPNLQEMLSLVDLYQRFINRKFEIYSKEKRKDDLTKPSVTRDYKILYQNCILQHKLLALGAIFPEKTLTKILSENEMEELNTLKEDLLRGDEKTGIINKIINGRPSFVHLTFAEYFAALWFVDKINSDKKEIKEIFLYALTFPRYKKIMQYFFNRILANNKELHIAVLNNDKESVQKLLSDENKANDIINSRDKAGRTALHLACAYGYSDIITILLYKLPDVDLNDNIFKWSALTYAVKGRRWGAAQLLLKKGANGSRMFDAISHVKKVVIDYLFGAPPST